MKSISKKDTKISSKSFPKALQNLPKWAASNLENQLPASTEPSRTLQDDFGPQHDPKMIEKSSHKASKMHPK